MNLTAGASLQNGKYILNNALGQSDLGITLKATQAFLNQPVVLKTLKPNPSIPMDFGQLRQRFLEEARRFAQCQHSNLVRVVDLFEESGVPFVVMDYVPGESLAEVVQSRHPMPEAKAIQYIRQIGSAIAVIHRQGLIHGDIKPKNIIRPVSTDSVVLVDYGISHRAALGITDPGGTASDTGYAAIEQIQLSSPINPATDIYSLAATLYFLVTGHPPIAANLRHQSPLQSPRKFQPHLSQALETAIMKGMELHAQARPQTIAAWFALLPGQDSLPPVQLSQGTETSAATVAVAKSSSNGSRQNPSPQPVAVQRPTPTPATRAIAPSIVSNTTPPLPHKSRLPHAVAFTAAIAIAAGLGAGLALRLSAVNGIGPRIFNTQQTFPPHKDWPGSAEPVAAPVPPLPAAPPVREIAPPPAPKPKASPSPSPSPQPQPSPEPSVEAAPSPSPTEPVAPITEPSPQPNLPPAEPVLPPPQASPTPLVPPKP